MRWLRDVPVADPVDRRNAPVLQVVMLVILGTAPPIWAYRFSLLKDVPWREDETLGFALSMGFYALAGFSLYLVRTGRFQWAVRQLMVVTAVLMLVSHSSVGFTGNRFEHPLLTVWIVTTGLMIGRTAVWTMCLAVLGAFALGVRVDVMAGEPASGMVTDGIISGLMFVLITAVVDRAATALRESLAAEKLRSDQLVVSNEQLEAEIRERERVMDQLVHARKMEVVGRLSSGLAHDFNHLLGLVQGYAGKGLQSAEPAAMREALQGVDGASRRAAAVATRLLDFGRADARSLETIDVATAVNDLRPVLRQLLSPDIAIDIEGPLVPVHIRFDPAQFELMVLNIAANAGDAMREGGHFSISVTASDGHARIRFSDTGIGMSEPVRRQVLEPFFTTKARGEGTGLGLALVSSMVGDAGGRIDVSSAPGEGTDLVIRIPAIAPDTPTRARRQLAGSAG
ncbi:sensor histidine kinase [Novilysobacter ciconiae]|uniref:sensor histidine kinase n=1 Tax=Novilysobacter ciconiae TaxID=2781022 RepID=UPI001D16FA19|nr:ATP-binding protein [Lysobacter ciconiae]